MNGLFVGLCVVAGFILGVRVGIALGHRSARRMMEAAKKAKQGRALQK